MTADEANILKGYWHYVVSELDNLIRNEYLALSCCKAEELLKHQERIKIYEGLKSLPDIVLERQGTSGIGPDSVHRTP